MQNAPVERIRQVWQFPQTISHVFFNSNDAQTVNVPAGAVHVLITVASLCFAKTGGAAAVPVGDVSDGSGVLVLMPGGDPTPYNVRSIASLSIIPDPDALAGTDSGTSFASFCWYGDT